MDSLLIAQLQLAVDRSTMKPWRSMFLHVINYCFTCIGSLSLSGLWGSSSLRMAPYFILFITHIEFNTQCIPSDKLKDCPQYPKEKVLARASSSQGHDKDALVQRKHHLRGPPWSRCLWTAEKQMTLESSQKRKPQKQPLVRHDYPPKEPRAPMLEPSWIDPNL